MSDIDRIFAARDWRSAVAAEITRQELEAEATELRLRAMQRRRETYRNAASVCHILVGAAIIVAIWLYLAHHPCLCLLMAPFAAITSVWACWFDGQSRT